MKQCRCGKAIVARVRKGGREREYCSDNCRKRAFRELHKYRRDILERIKDDDISNAIDQQIHRETWQDEMGYLINLVEKQQRLCECLKKDISYLEEDKEKLHAELGKLCDVIAEKNAEIARLQVIVEYHGKKRGSPKSPA